MVGVEFKTDLTIFSPWLTTPPCSSAMLSTRTPMQMQNDAERLNRLQLDGFTAMQFTYHDVVTTSPVMVATLHEALPPAPTRPFGPDS